VDLNILKIITFAKKKTMKTIVTLLIVTMLGIQYSSAQKAEHFGDKINPDGALSVSEFKSKMKAADSLNVKFTGVINEACQKKGCWMNVDLGNGESMMVRFKDYGFFVPKDCNGKTAIMEGVAFKETVSVEMLQHYAEDAGKSKDEIAKITQPETKISFEANGVIIYAKK
jgi:hypothetical protein